MLRRALMTAALAAVAAVGALSPSSAQAAGEGQPADWGRFNYYPYVYYPHNFQRPVQFDHMYYRYPAERRIPVYNTNWHNFYTMPKPYHRGHFDKLDVF
jgi:hypothetical protein